MRKKGLIGKIFLIAGIIFLIIVIFIGLTIWQGYRTYQIAMVEQAKMQKSAQEMQDYMNSGNINGVCQKVTELETSGLVIKTQTQSSCKNPLISFAVKIAMAKQPIQTPNGTITMSCSNMDLVYSQALDAMTPIKNICNNQTFIEQYNNQTKKS